MSRGSKPAFCGVFGRGGKCRPTPYTVLGEVWHVDNGYWHTDNLKTKSIIQAVALPQQEDPPLLSLNHNHKTHQREAVEQPSKQFIA